MRRATSLVALTACLLGLAQAPALAGVPGDLDTSFSDDGRIVVELGRLVAATDVLIRANGSVVTVGVTNGRFAVARHTRDGAPDRSFSGNGRTATRLGTGAYVVRALPMKRGRLVVAGAVSGGKFALVRYLRNGRRDSSFGRRGKVRTQLPAWDSSLEDIVLDRRGRILVAGTLDSGRFVRVRYSRSGRRDRTFGKRGIDVTRESLPPSAEAATVRLQRNGRLVVAGWIDLVRPLPLRQVFVARYAPNGTLDPSFGGGDGWTSLGDGAADVRAATLLIQRNRKLLVGGNANGSTTSVLARFTRTGNPDASLGGDGIVTHSFAGVSAAIDGLTRQGNGDILATGTLAGAFTLARYHRDGSVDTGFGSDGITETFFEPERGGHSSGRAVATRGSHIVVVGGHYTGSEETYDGDFAIARYLKR